MPTAHDDNLLRRELTEALAAEYALWRDDLPPEELRGLEADFLAHVDAYVDGMAARMLRQPPTADQLQEARIAALTALRSYQPGRSTYRHWLSYYVRKALFRQRQDDPISLPEYLRLLLPKLARAEAEHWEFHDSSPSDSYLCEHLCITPDTLEAAYQVRSLSYTSPETLPASDSAAAPHMDALTLSVDVAFALDKLAETDEQAAQVAVLIHLHDFSIDAACQFLRISYRTALAALDRAAEALRCLLSDYQ